MVRQADRLDIIGRTDSDSGPLHISDSLELFSGTATTCTKRGNNHCHCSLACAKILLMCPLFQLLTYSRNTGSFYHLGHTKECSPIVGTSTDDMNGRPGLTLFSQFSNLFFTRSN